MLRIRLRRVGKKKQPMYRIVVADSRAPRDGKFVDAIGIYHPLENPSKIEIDAERAKMWLEKGAQPSDRVAKLFVIQSIMPELPKKLQARIELIKSRPKPVKEEPAGVAPAAAASAPAPAPAAPPAADTSAPEEAPAAAEGPAAEQAPAAEAAAEPPAEQPAEAEAPSGDTAEEQAPA